MPAKIKNVLQKPQYKIHRIALTERQRAFLKTKNKSISAAATSAILENIQDVTNEKEDQNLYKTISIPTAAFEKIKAISGTQNKSIAEIIRACIDKEIKKCSK
ncbi:MAG: hypothetical protein IPN68_18640 [Bacteroidetes bacterium]|nr:hypothetical protein [Bacteroidota bacterium]